MAFTSVHSFDVLYFTSSQCGLCWVSSLAGSLGSFLLHRAQAGARDSNLLPAITCGVTIDICFT